MNKGTYKSNIKDAFKKMSIKEWLLIPIVIILAIIYTPYYLTLLLYDKFKNK